MLNPELSQRSSDVVGHLLAFVREQRADPINPDGGEVSCDVRPRPCIPLLLLLKVHRGGTPLRIERSAVLKKAGTPKGTEIFACSHAWAAVAIASASNAIRPATRLRGVRLRPQPWFIERPSLPLM